MGEKGGERGGVSEMSQADRRWKHDPASGYTPLVPRIATTLQADILSFFDIARHGASKTF